MFSFLNTSPNIEIKLDYLFVHINIMPVKLKNLFLFKAINIEDAALRTFFYTIYYCRALVGDKIFYPSVLTIETAETPQIVQTTIFTENQKKEFLEFITAPFAVFEDCDRYCLYYKGDIKNEIDLAEVITKWRMEIIKSLIQN